MRVGSADANKDLCPGKARQAVQRPAKVWTARRIIPPPGLADVKPPILAPQFPRTEGVQHQATTAPLRRETWLPAGRAVPRRVTGHTTPGPHSLNPHLYGYRPQPFAAAELEPRHP